MANQKVSQIEAAQRQLDTAILLWFQDGDLVSAHTLAAAAHGIIHDLNRANKGPPLLFDSPTIDPKLKRESVAILKAFENFCKHADNRKREVKEMELEPRVTVAFMFACLWGLTFLGQKHNSVELAFRSWVWVHHPEFLNKQTKEAVAKGLRAERAETLRTVPKALFLKEFLKVSAGKKTS